MGSSALGMESRLTAVETGVIEKCSLLFNFPGVGHMKSIRIEVLVVFLWHLLEFN